MKHHHHGDNQGTETEMAVSVTVPGAVMRVPEPLEGTEEAAEVRWTLSQVLIGGLQDSLAHGQTAVRSCCPEGVCPTPTHRCAHLKSMSLFGSLRQGLTL